MSAFNYHFNDGKDRQWPNSNMYYPWPSYVLPYRGFIPNYFHNYGSRTPNNLGNYYPVMPNNFGYNPVMASPLHFKRNPTYGDSKAHPQRIGTPVSVCEKVIVKEVSNEVPKNWIKNEPTSRPSKDQQIAIAKDIRTNNHQTRRPPTRRICNLCRQNGECRAWYLDHPIKDSKGKVVCPVLFKVVCPICNATGENAHTVFYCPLKQKTNSGLAPQQRPLAIRLKNTSYDSCGRLKRSTGIKKF